MKHLSWIRGLVVWLLLASLGIAYLGRSLDARGTSTAQFGHQLWDFTLRPTSTATLSFPNQTLLAVGDPVFWYQGDRPRRVGEVAAVTDPHTGQAAKIAWVTKAQVRFYPGVPTLAGARLNYHRTPTDFAWAVQTFLPPEKRAQVQTLVAAALERHQGTIVAALRPIVQQGLRDAIAVVEADLPAVLLSHREALQAIAARYQKDLVEDQILPLVKEQILPSARKELEPLVTEVGQELWGRVSLVGFGWAYFKDSMPFLSKSDRLKQEWQMFLEKDALPVMEENSEELLAAVQRIVSSAAKNEEVQQVFKSSLTAIIEDQELQALVWRIVRQLVIDNPKMQQVLTASLQSPAAQAAFRLTGELLEPTITELGEVLFGSEEQGISPEFAAVLRNRVLFKDRRWLVLEPAARPNGPKAAANPAASQVLPVAMGSPSALNPFAARMARP